MGGYAITLGECFGCGRMFGFNPHRVPSIPINGIRRPICRECVEAANPRRVDVGLAPIEILPGAYEPIEAGEL